MFLNHPSETPIQPDGHIKLFLVTIDLDHEHHKKTVFEGDNEEATAKTPTLQKSQEKSDPADESSTIAIRQQSQDLIN